MPLKSLWLALSVLLLPLLGTAYAEAPAPSKVSKSKVDVELLFDRDTGSPGETLWVGVRLRPEAGWHVYWKFPGDTGLPTRVTFEGPDGADFGEMAWPAPQRFVDKLGGRSFGFENELLLTSTLRIPESAQPGQPFEIEAKLGWLVCKENCIQGNATLGFNLPISDEQSPRNDHAALFDSWHARIPHPASEAPAFKVEVEGAPVAPGSPFAVTLSLDDPTLAWVSPIEEAFIPATEGLEIHTIKAQDEGNTKRLRLEGKATSDLSPKTTRLESVIRFQQGEIAKTFDLVIDIPRAAAPAETVANLANTANTQPSVANQASSLPVLGDPCADIAPLDISSSESPISSVGLGLLFAFLGGLLLNAMPCVLPVLSLKVLSIVEQSQENPKVIWRHGLTYTAGVLVSFLAMAILLLVLQQSSWAFQFQDPGFVAVFTAVVFAFALSLFGVFEIALPGTSRLDAKVANSHGYMSSFNYGVFAVILGTPCTAPFLGPALTYAFTQPPVTMVLMLLTVGLGLAFPFLLLARFPAWRRWMPKPGDWLITFKKIMAFLLVGTAIFMLSIFAAQVSRSALIQYLVFLGFLSFALFVYGHWTDIWRPARTRLIASAISLGIVVWASLSFIKIEPPEAVAAHTQSGEVAWLDFKQTDVNARAQAGELVFIDFTAAWCTTCKVNEATAIHTDTVEKLFKDLRITAVKGDFTHHDDGIASWLSRFNEPSVPLYVVIPPGRPEAAFKLPTLLSEEDVMKGVCHGWRNRL